MKSLKLGKFGIQLRVKTCDENKKKDNYNKIIVRMRSRIVVHASFEKM